MTFDALFHHHDPERSRYLNGLFNLFARDIIDCWAGDSHAPYTNLGKATLRQAGMPRGNPVDFAFQDQRKNLVYAVIMYCDPLDDAPLRDPDQIAQLSATRTFGAFLEAAANPAPYTVLTRREEYPVAGSILIWSSIESKKARASIRRAYNFQNLLSVEDIIHDLVTWQNRDFQMLLDRRAAWSHDFFRGLRRVR